MLTPFILLLSSLFILLSLKQILTVSIVLRDELYLSFDFLFINLTIYPFKSTARAFRKNKAKRDKKPSIGKRFSKGKKQLLILNEIIRRSDVSVSTIELSVKDERPNARVLKRQGVFAVLSALIGAIENSSRSFSYNGVNFNESDANFDVNINFKTSLLDIVTSLFSYKLKERNTN